MPEMGRAGIELGGEPRRAWRAGWRLGHDEHVANRRVWEAGVRAYGGGAAGRTN